MTTISNGDWDLILAAGYQQQCRDLAHADHYRIDHDYGRDLPAFCGECGGKVHLHV